MGKTVANAKEIEMAKKCVSTKSSSQLLHSGTSRDENAVKNEQISVPYFFVPPAPLCDGAELRFRLLVSLNFVPCALG